MSNIMDKRVHFLVMPSSTYSAGIYSRGVIGVR